MRMIEHESKAQLAAGLAKEISERLTESIASHGSAFFYCNYTNSILSRILRS